MWRNSPRGVIAFKLNEMPRRCRSCPCTNQSARDRKGFIVDGKCQMARQFWRQRRRTWNFKPSHLCFGSTTWEHASTSGTNIDQAHWHRDKRSQDGIEKWHFGSIEGKFSEGTVYYGQILIMSSGSKLYLLFIYTCCLYIWRMLCVFIFGRVLFLWQMYADVTGACEKMDGRKQLRYRYGLQWRQLLAESPLAVTVLCFMKYHWHNDYVDYVHCRCT